MGQQATARKTIDTLFGLSMQSGPAAAIGAFGALPEAVQTKQLENDAESTKRSYDLEEKQLVAQERERDAQRKHVLESRRRELEYEERREKRNYWLVVVILLVASGVVVGLFIASQFAVAVPMMSGLIGLGAGFKGGESVGFKNATREIGKTKTEALPPGAE